MDRVYPASLLVGDLELGKMLLEFGDPSMGGMNGQLFPSPPYRELQPRFVAAEREGRGTYELGLDLRVRLADGLVLEPAGGISVTDFEEDLGEIGVDLGGVDSAQLEGRGLVREFLWGRDDGGEAEYFFEVVDGCVTRQLTVSGEMVASSHENDPTTGSPALAETPLADWYGAFVEAGGRSITQREFLDVWRPHVDNRQASLSAALELGRERGLRVRAAEFRWHPLHGEHVLLAVDAHAPCVGIIALDEFKALPGVSGRTTGEGGVLRPRGIDGSLGVLVFGGG